MKTQFTKGEWYVFTHRSGCKAVGIVLKSTFTVAKINSQFPLTEEAEANAKLIATAPELYNAAYSALQAIYLLPKKRREFFHYLIRDLTTALNKANGTYYTGIKNETLA